MARYLVGTRPINMMSIQVIKSKTAVERLVNAINPQITPHQKRIGISDSFISVNILLPLGKHTRQVDNQRQDWQSQMAEMIQ